jgi:hypothetical protein
MSAAGQIMSAELHGEALLTAKTRLYLSINQKDAGQLVVVESSAAQTFPAGTGDASVPMIYDGLVSEVVINFHKVGQSSRLTIESVRLD